MKRASRIRSVLVTGALVIGVTVGSVALGAALVSPTTAQLLARSKTMLAAVTAEQYAVGAGVLTLALMLTVVTPRLRRLLAARATHRATHRAGLQPRMTPTTTAPAPTFSFSRTDRTPRAVQALAQQGAQPTEIAWRTGLPVDAVSLLLAMSTASRQLQPPQQ